MVVIGEGLFPRAAEVPAPASVPLYPRHEEDGPDGGQDDPEPEREDQVLPHPVAEQEAAEGQSNEPESHHVAAAQASPPLPYPSTAPSRRDLELALKRVEGRAAMAESQVAGLKVIVADLRGKVGMLHKHRRAEDQGLLPLGGTSRKSLERALEKSQRERAILEEDLVRVGRHFDVGSKQQGVSVDEVIRRFEAYAKAKATLALEAGARAVCMECRTEKPKKSRGRWLHGREECPAWAIYLMLEEEYWPGKGVGGSDGGE